MDKITPEQRDEILGFARNNLDPEIKCPITGYVGNSHLRYGSLREFLNANTTEDVPIQHHELFKHDGSSTKTTNTTEDEQKPEWKTGTSDAFLDDIQQEETP